MDLPQEDKKDELVEFKKPDLKGVAPDVTEYIKSLEAMVDKPTELGEAGGIAFVDLFAKKTDKNGIPHMLKISVTERAGTSEIALRKLLKTLSVADSLHLNPWPPDLSVPAKARESAPAPASVPSEPAPLSVMGGVMIEESAAVRKPVMHPPTKTPVRTPAPAGSGAASGDTGEVTITVDTVKHTVTPNGTHNLIVKGGRWKKHGVVAWEEAIPPSAEGWVEWEIGTEFSPPEGMGKAVILMEEDKPKKVQRFVA